MEKAKEVVSTIDRVHQLSLYVPGVGANLQIATVLALREMLFVPNFNDVVHFLVVRVVYTRMGPINSLFRPFQLPGSGFSTRVESQRLSCLIELILPGRTIQVHCRSVEKSKRLNRSVGTAVRSTLDWRIAPCNDAIMKPASSSQSFLRDRSPLFTAALKQYATAWRISSKI